jgi:hypothetical protein
MSIPTSTYRVRCSCDAMCVAHNNMLHAIQFLTGLNDNFNVMKSQILLIDLLPSMAKTFSMVLQHEHHNGSIVLGDSKALINASSDSKNHSSPSGKSAYPPSGSKICRHDCFLT